MIDEKCSFFLCVRSKASCVFCLEGHLNLKRCETSKGFRVILLTDHKFDGLCAANCAITGFFPATLPLRTMELVIYDSLSATTVLDLKWKHNLRVYFAFFKVIFIAFLAHLSGVLFKCTLYTNLKCLLFFICHSQTILHLSACISSDFSWNCFSYLLLFLLCIVFCFV